MSIGIVTAMPEESKTLLAQAHQVRKRRMGAITLYDGYWEKQPFSLAEGGMGMSAASQAARLLISETRPDLLISAGFCGAVRPGLNTGDLVFCSRLFTAEGSALREVIIPESNPSTDLVLAELRTRGLTACRGSFITTPSIMTKRSLAEQLPTNLPHPVLEMESAAVALAAHAANLPFVGLRAVSDDASEELQFSLDEICGGDGQVSVLRVMGLLVRRPGLLAQFLRLASGSSRAGKNLHHAFRVVLQML